jgi:hypothetical protein
MICVPRFYPGAGPAGGGGAAPDVTVATFADLPTTRPDGYLVAVTAQSGLTEVIVRWDNSGGVWLLEQATCAYSVHSAVQFAGAGEWYDTGGITVETADGAYVKDTTYDVVWRWASTPAQFVPPDVYAGTIVIRTPLVGDSATPTDWTTATIDAGGTASITTDGTKLTLSAVTSGAGDTVAYVLIADAGLLTATNAYMRALVQNTTLTAGTGNAQAIFRATLEDGTDGFDFGSMANVGFGGSRTGGWFDAANSNDYAAQSAITQNLTSTETLLELRKIGAKIEARAGGAASTWQAIAGATARNTAATQFYFVVNANRTSGTSTTIATIREVCPMRF